MTNLELRKTLNESIPLGQKSAYPKNYDPKQLFAVERSLQRKSMGLDCSAMSHGLDQWVAYELSWLDSFGKPKKAIAQFLVPSSSLFLAESKSVKLYLNSLNFEKFAHENEVKKLIEKDLFAICQAEIKVELNPPQLESTQNTLADYFCLDDLPVQISSYQREPRFLAKVKKEEQTHEKLCSHLFKSHCLVTGQPDWGSIFIEYSGAKINHEGLLRYLVSYNQHVGFSENCIEQIFCDLWALGLDKLMVFGRFTRRGGIEINPYRASFKTDWPIIRLSFQ